MRQRRSPRQKPASLALRFHAVLAGTLAVDDVVIEACYARHPGAAAVIPAVVHARRACGISVFPGCQLRHSFRFQPQRLRWNVNSGSAAVVAALEWTPIAAVRAKTPA